MTYSRHDIDTSWADLGGDDTGADDSEPRQRHSGMDGTEVENYDPAAVVAALGPRGGTAETPAPQASFDDLGIRPSWHEAATPEPVAEAWSALLQAIEAALEADADQRSLSGEQASAERTAAARIRGLVASGKSVKLSATPGRQWDGERRHLEAVSAGRRDRATRCRATYDALVLEHRAGWNARIIEGLPSSKAATLAALSTAGQMVERLLGDAQAAQALSLEEGGSLVPLPVLPVRRAVEAMEALAGEIDGSVALGGEGLVHPRMEPSFRDREQMAASIRHGVSDGSGHWLAELERREGYRLSAFTRGIALGPKPSEAAEW